MRVNRFTDRAVIVLGAGSSAPGTSIGRASALAFAREGANVVAVDIDAAAAQETVSLIEAEKGRAVARVGDIADGRFVTDLVAETVDRLGGVDVLHHNVGIGKTGGPADFTPDEWERIHRVNVTSLLTACQAALPHMVARGRGAIVTMSSVSALRYSGTPHLAYSVTKSALLQFIRLIAAQYAANNIRANVVVPGFIDTPRVEFTVAKAHPELDFADWREKQNKRVPMNRMGTAAEVADAVLFLASDEASYITGTELVVDGGATLTMR